MRRRISRGLLVGLVVLSACGGDSVTGTDGGLQGTWILVSVNGVDAPQGTLTWTITAATITAHSGPPDQCVETGSYTVSGNTITVTTTSLSGDGCGGEIGEVFEFTFALSGDTLTATIQDPDLGTGVFVFRRD